MKPAFTTSPEVAEVFANYPEAARKRMEELRALVIETAKETPEVSRVEECLKWGEPSYVTNVGSTLRMDWKVRSPEQFAVYFKCTSRLVPTFRQVFSRNFSFEGNRAIVFGLTDELPREPLKACIKAALRYHKVKKHPTLDL